jgi:hypothetical protein
MKESVSKFEVDKHGVGEAADDLMKLLSYLRRKGLKRQEKFSFIGFIKHQSHS